MTDLSDLTTDELLAKVSGQYLALHGVAMDLHDELRRRLAAGEQAEARVVELERERDEAYESCRMMEDRLNRLVAAQSGAIDLETTDQYLSHRLSEEAKRADAAEFESVRLLAENTRLREAVRDLWTTVAFYVDADPEVTMPSLHAACPLVDALTTPPPRQPHPCPSGDGCALNRGAVHCLACGRNWPPDHTWDDRKAER